MAQYLVTWSIDIEADTPEEAAMQALTVQPESTATVFDVTDKEELCDIVSIDLGSQPNLRG